MDELQSPGHYIMCFNTVLRKLTLELTVRFPNDPAMTRAKKRILLAIETWPAWTIGEIGKGIYKYKAQLEAGELDFFLENKFDGERRKAALEDPEKAKLTDHILPKIKDAFAIADENEQQTYYDKVVALLDLYVDYLLVTTKRKPEPR